jgi:hypothetical protein
VLKKAIMPYGTFYACNSILHTVAHSVNTHIGFKIKLVIVLGEFPFMESVTGCLRRQFRSYKS